MSEILGTAFVAIRPLTTGFLPELERQVKPAAAAVSAQAGSTRSLAAAEASATRETARLATATGQLAGTQRAATGSTNQLAASQTRLAGSAGAAGAALQGTSAASRAALLGLSPLGAAAAAAGAGALFSLKQFASFEKQLNVFQQIAKATGDEMRDVSRRAKELGADITLPGTSATDAAEAMTELAKAGLDVQEAMDAAKGTLQLAAAAETDNATAAKVAGSALNAFGLAGSEAVRVADLLAGAAIAAQGEIGDMSFALAQASAVARQTGVSIEDTATFIALLAKNGILGGRAGTSLRVALLNLAAPSAAGAKELKKLNVQIRDANGSIRPEVFDDLGKALSGLDAAARDASLRRIFGTDAIRAASIFIREGEQGFDDLAATVTETGNAGRLAQAKMEGLAGAVEGLRSNVETLALGIGQVLGPIITDFIEDLTTLVGLANEAASGIERIARVRIPGTDLGLGRLAKEVVTRTGPLGVYTNLKTGIEFAIGKGGEDGGEKMAQNISTALQKNLAQIGKTIVDIASQASQIEARDVRARPTDADFELKILRATSDESRVPLLQRRAEFIQKLIDRIEGQKDLSAKEKDNLIRLYEEQDAAEAEILSIREAGIAREEARAREQERIARERERAAKLAADAEQRRREEAARALRDSIQLEQQRLNLQLQIAETTRRTTADDRSAQDQIIEFLREQVRNARLTAAERLSFQSELVSIQQQIADAERQLFLDQTAASREEANLKIQRAQLTARNLKDDAKFTEQLITVLKRQLRDARFTDAERRGLRSELIGAQLQLQGIREEQRDRIRRQREAARRAAGDRGARTRSRVNFFQEAVDAFRRFGSNIATPGAGGVLSAQQARGTFGGLALQNAGSRAIQVAEQQRQRQLTEAERQTVLLSGILNAVAGSPGGIGGRDRRPDIRVEPTSNRSGIDTVRILSGVANLVN